MVWEAILGGVVGGLLGGPWGMAAGAALGAGWDVIRGRAAPPLGARLRLQPGEDGWILTAALPDLPEGCAAVWQALDVTGEPLRAASPRLADAAGRLRLLSAIRSGETACFLPYGSLIDPPSLLTVSLQVFQGGTADELDRIGEDRISAAWPDNSWSEARFWRPLLGLCMAVTRADGGVSRVEIQQLRGFLSSALQLPAEEQDAVTAVLRAEPSRTLPALIADLQLRAPAVEPAAVLRALVDVARADGGICEPEAAILVEVARLLGVTGPAWESLSAELGIAQIDHLAHYRQLLGVPAGATVEQIAESYHAQLATIPEDIEPAAAERRREALARARDSLLDILA